METPRVVRHEDDMLELKRPEPKAALTWIAVWAIALTSLAIPHMDGANSKFAATPDKLHYS